MTDTSVEPFRPVVDPFEYIKPKVERGDHLSDFEKRWLIAEITILRIEARQLRDEARAFGSSA